MAETRVWPALVIREDERSSAGAADADSVSATLDDFEPFAIQDLTELPLPPGGLWDPTCPPIPDPPSRALHWRVFFQARTQRDGAAARVRAAHPTLVTTPEDIADDDWAAISQRELTAIRAGSYVVAPPWDVPPTIAPGETLIVIEPSRGFGTGHHASTRLCLRALSQIDVRDRRVLDLGTGSGVLAIAAAKRGAREVIAIDIDHDAIDAARHSAALNDSTGAVRWTAGDFRDDAGRLLDEPWDVVLANLTGAMLIASADRVRSLAGNRGTLIVSGFDQDERPRVERALAMPLVAAFDEDNWVGLMLGRG